MTQLPMAHEGTKLFNLDQSCLQFQNRGCPPTIGMLLRSGPALPQALRESAPDIRFLPRSAGLWAHRPPTLIHGLPDPRSAHERSSTHCKHCAGTVRIEHD